MIFIPFTIIFIIFYILLFIYYLYSSLQYVRIASDKYIFYINNIITLIPPVLYSYNLCNIVIYSLPLEAFIIQNFIIEWSITTPLILLNITQIARLKAFKQIILCFFSFLMNISGFIANGFHQPNDILIWYSLGVSCICIIFGNLIWIYYKRNWVFFKDIVSYKKYVYSLNTLFYTVLISWSFYPIVFIVYKYNILNIEYTSLLFMCLDFISKGVFIGNIVRFADILHYTDSFTHQIQLSEQSIINANQIVPYI